MPILARGSSVWRAQEWGAGCDTSVLVTVPWIIGAGKITCHYRAAAALRALGRVYRQHRYAVRSEVTGCYNCRVITGGKVPSSHAQGIGIDVNWDTNPYRTDRLVTDMPPELAEAIEAIETRGGVKAFRWGGDWDGRPETPHSNYDAMHSEIVATIAELLVGFDAADFDVRDNLTWPLLARGDRGRAVERLQNELAGALPFMRTDGIFGGDTDAAVRSYQKAHGLNPDGFVGLATWTALFTDAPAGAPAIDKGHVAGGSSSSAQAVV